MANGDQRDVNGDVNRDVSSGTYSSGVNYGVNDGLVHTMLPLVDVVFPGWWMKVTSANPPSLAWQVPRQGSCLMQPRHHSQATCSKAMRPVHNSSNSSAGAL